MRQRPNVTDPQVQETDKRRFQRMRVRKKFGKEFLSEIKQCVQKTDYLVNRPTPLKAKKKTISSPTKKKTKKIEKKVDEDDLYPHVKFVIHPRIQNHKIPKFLNNQNIHQYSKTMAPVNEDQDYAKRSLSSSDQAKDRYNLSTLSATNVSDSNSSNAEIHDDAQHNSELNQNNINSPNRQENNSSDSFDDSAHMASLNNDKIKKEVNQKVSNDSDYSDSDANVPTKPKWKFSDSDRRGKSSAFSSNDFRWSKNNQINKISSSSDSDAVALEKIREEMKREIEQDENEKPGSNEMFFGSDSNENPNENDYPIKNMKNNRNESKSSSSKNRYNSPLNEKKIASSLENSDNYNSTEETKNISENENKIEVSSDIDSKSKNANKADVKENENVMKEPEIDSDFDEVPINDSRQNYKKNAGNKIQNPNIHSQEDSQQYSSDYANLKSKNKKISIRSKLNQYSSDSNSNDAAFNSMPTPQSDEKKKLYNSQYSSSGDYAQEVRNESKHSLEIDKEEIIIDEEEQVDEKDDENSIGQISSQKAEKDRISPELEKSLINSNSSRKHFVESLSDGYDDEEENNQFFQNKPAKQEKMTDFSSSTPAIKDVDIPVSTEGEVDNTFNFASSTSESPAIAKKKSIEIENNIDDEEDNSDLGFGNEDKVFYTGKNSSSSEDYEIVEATTDTRENEIRENRKLDRRIYSGEK